MTITPEYVANWFRKKFIKNHPYCEAGLEVSSCEEKATVIIFQDAGSEQIKITVTVEGGSV